MVYRDVGGGYCSDPPIKCVKWKIQVRDGSDLKTEATSELYLYTPPNRGHPKRLLNMLPYTSDAGLAS